jgi:hypothetical protein
VERLDGGSGSQEWQYTPAGTFFIDASGLTMGPDGDLVAVFDESIAKLRATDGAELWTATAFPLLSAFAEAPVALDAQGDLLIVSPQSAQVDVIELSGTTGDVIASEVVAAGIALGPWAIAAHPRGLVAAGQAPAGDTRTLFSVFGFGDRATGRKLLLKDPGDPAGRRLRLVAKDPWMALPAAATASAPTVVGATLELSNANTAESVTIALPASNWSEKPSPFPGAATFKYVDRTLAAGPCKVVVLKGNRALKAGCDGPGSTFSLDEAQQGTVDVRLSFPGGGGFSRCLAFGGTTIVDQPGQFIAKDAGAPTTCSGGL